MYRNPWLSISTHMYSEKDAIKKAAAQDCVKWRNAVYENRIARAGMELQTKNDGYV